MAFALRTMTIQMDPVNSEKYEEAMAKEKMHHPWWDQGSCGWEGDDKGNVGQLEDIVPAYFCEKEDVTRESLTVILDAEEGEDRSLPR